MPGTIEEARRHRSMLTCNLGPSACDSLAQYVHLTSYCSMQMQETAGAASEAKGQADEAKSIFFKLRSNEVAQSADLLTAPVAGKSSEN